MPVYLPAPQRDPRGPDGQGWNRLAILAQPRDQCALRPQTYAAWREAQDTRRAAYGHYGTCGRAGSCDGCPRRDLTTTLEAFTPRVLFRLDPAQTGLAFAVNHPDRGWSSWAQEWTWVDLLALEGWAFDGEHTDEHGRGFWLRKARP